MNPDRPELDHLVIQRANGRMTQPYNNPRMLFWLMFHLAPVIPMDATWFVVPKVEE